MLSYLPVLLLSAAERAAEEARIAAEAAEAARLAEEQTAAAALEEAERLAHLQAEQAAAEALLAAQQKRLFGAGSWWPLLVVSVCVDILGKGD